MESPKRDKAALLTKGTDRIDRQHSSPLAGRQPDETPPASCRTMDDTDDSEDRDEAPPKFTDGTARWYHTPLPLPSIQQLRHLARRHGGHCLATKCDDITTRLSWECAQRHRFSAFPNDIQRGRWCPECTIAKRQQVLLDARHLATSHGGKLTTSQCWRDDPDLDWRCAKGHSFMEKFSAVKAGYWCYFCPPTETEAEPSAARLRRENYAERILAKRAEKRLRKLTIASDSPNNG